ncbi:MAG: hypothetical protein NTY94_01625 [Alphaproteobacteria bacterium]|nr:hypothetical protein [Alphaproteobacteria bacterium]
MGAEIVDGKTTRSIPVKGQGNTLYFIWLEDFEEFLQKYSEISILYEDKLAHEDLFLIPAHHIIFNHIIECRNLLI